MADNDEPLDDLRAVTMQAGAAAARVIETVVRDQQHRAQQPRDAVNDQHRRAAAQTAAVAISQTAAETLPYDSPQRRSATNEAMRAAGVPDEVRHAIATADLMNGVDPALAAAGSRRKPAGRPANTASQRERGR